MNKHHNYIAIANKLDEKVLENKYPQKACNHSSSYIQCITLVHTGRGQRDRSSLCIAIMNKYTEEGYYSDQVLPSNLFIIAL